jgi:ribonuclease HII
MWSYEKKAALSGFSLVAGVAEAGRGPLAGPVVSAAVILPDHFQGEGVRDSKKLTPNKRDKLYNLIYAQAVSVGVGIADHEEIDHLNILQASLLSMTRAVNNLVTSPDYLLIDGIFTISYNAPQEAIKKGDSLSISIAAASIVAKVTRDRIMETYHNAFPHYGFSVHKGYPTQAHKEAISVFGPCSIHRKTFKGVKEYF